MTKDEALNLALEALKSTGENNGYHGVTQYFDETMVDQAITAIKAALEAKDEPVAYVPYGVFDAWLDQAWLGVRCLNPQLCDPDKVDVQPIYAYPNSQRKPLTDEELTEIFSTTKGLDFYLNFARAIEAAHGITKETK